MLLYYLKETKVFNKKFKIFNMLIFWSEGNENTTFFRFDFLLHRGGFAISFFSEFDLITDQWQNTERFLRFNGFVVFIIQIAYIRLVV